MVVQYCAKMSVLFSTGNPLAGWGRRNAREGRGGEGETRGILGVGGNTGKHVGVERKTTKSKNRFGALITVGKDGSSDSEVVAVVAGPGGKQIRWSVRLKGEGRPFAGAYRLPCQR